MMFDAPKPTQITSCEWLRDFIAEQLRKKTSVNEISDILTTQLKKFDTVFVHCSGVKEAIESRTLSVPLTECDKNILTYEIIQPTTAIHKQRSPSRTLTIYNHSCEQSAENDQDSQNIRVSANANCSVIDRQRVHAEPVQRRIPPPHGRAFYTSPPASITVCVDRMSSQSEIEQAIRHEVTHAVDHSIVGMDLTICGPLACSEIRAATLGECRLKSLEVLRRACVSRRAQHSTQLVFPDVGAQCVRDVWKRCYHSDLAANPVADVQTAAV